MLYRITLKIDKVNIRVKESIPIEAIITHKNQIANQIQSTLNNGKAEFGKTSEFYLPIRNPYFQIVIHLRAKNDTKFVGFVEVKLNRQGIRNSHEISEKLKKCPDNSAEIKFNLWYRTETLPINRNLARSRVKQLLNQNQYEELIFTNEQDKDETKFLKNKNKLLKKEIESLTKIRQQLKVKSTQLTKNHQQQLNKYADQINRVSKQCTECNEILLKTQNQKEILNTLLKQSFPRKRIKANQKLQ